MPSLYQLAMLCEDVYKNKNLTHWESIDKQLGLEDCQIGYSGEAFINKENKEIVIAHRGIKICSSKDKLKINLNINKLHAYTSYSNLIRDIFIALQFISPETQPGLYFTLRIAGVYPDYKIIQTGHSLGGFRAHIIGYICKQEVVAFDCPGWLEQLQALSTCQIDYYQLRKHHSILADINLISQLNTQVGNVYKPITHNILNNQRKCMISSIDNPLKSHSLQSLIDYFPLSNNDYNVEIPYVFIFLNENVVNQTPQLKINENGELKSIVDNKLIYTKKTWIVSVIKAGSCWSGHALIIVEGIDDDNAPFVRQYNIFTITTDRKMCNASISYEYSSNTKGIIVNIRERHTVYPHANNFYKKTQSKSKLRPKSDVIKMIDSIKKDIVITKKAQEGKGEYIKYQRYSSPKNKGWLSLLSESDGNMSWEFLVTRAQ